MRSPGTLQKSRYKIQKKHFINKYHVINSNCLYVLLLGGCPGYGKLKTQGSGNKAYFVINQKIQEEGLCHLSPKYHHGYLPSC